MNRLLNMSERLKDYVLDYFWVWVFVVIGIVLTYGVILSISNSNELSIYVNNHDCKSIKQFGEQHQEYLNQVIADLKLEGCQ